MESASMTPAAPAPERLRFTGSGGEYFRIWIVNLLLTILTLGIYSAWAKVRRLQYFYRSTELAGTGFEYHGQPLAILLGRVVAVALLLVYKYSFTLSPTLGFVVLGLLFAIGPWLMRSSLRFRLHNSSYRGLRFGFRGSLGGAYIASYSGLLMILAIVVGIGIAAALSKVIAGLVGFVGVLAIVFWVYPAWYQRFKHYQHNGARYGQASFSFDATVGQFAWVFFLGFAIAIGLVVIGGILAGLTGSLASFAALQPGQKPDPKAFAAILPLVLVFYAGLFLLIGPFFRSRIDNLIWNHTRLGAHRLESTQTTLGLFGLYATNLIGIVFTLGLFTPWAMVRLARYHAENLSFVAAEPIDRMIAAQEAESSAIGEEVVSVFDFDIAL
ncbi:MAG: DUF898 family protein [Nevskia sp.]